MTRTCIACPRGCKLTISATGAQISVSGNRCAKGEEYGIAEATDPRRILTTTVRTLDPAFPRQPVRTDRPIPLASLPEAMERVFAIELDRPAELGSVIVHDFVGPGINLIVSGVAEFPMEASE